MSKGSRGAVLGILALAGTALAADPAPSEPVERYIVDAAVKLRVEPEYPPAALAAATDGEVTVDFDISIFGTVTNPKVTASTPPGVFDAEALATIRFWTFIAANEPRECRRLVQHAQQTFRFHAALPESQRVEVLPTAVEGIPSPDRPVVRAHTLEEIRAALAQRYPYYRLPDPQLIPVKRTEPRFPQKALIKGLSGFTTVKFRVTETGTVEDLAVTESLPAGLYDAVTLDAVKRWRFEPLIKDGQPVSRMACQTIDYKLSK